MLVIEQRDAAVDHELAIADARRELVQAERQSRRESALTQDEQFLRRVHDVCQRAADGAPQADAEQVLCGGIQIPDEQGFVQDEQRRRKPLQDVVGARRSARTPARGRDVVGAG